MSDTIFLPLSLISVGIDHRSSIFPKTSKMANFTDVPPESTPIVFSS